jgi:LCP family protein required for cell wall assembly
VTDRRPRASLRVAGRAVVALLSVSLLVVSGWAWMTWHDFTSHIPRVTAIGAGPASPAKRTDIDGKDQNILIVGNDDRSTATDAELRELGTTRDGGSLNTDTMMVLHAPADGRKATVIGIPRDSYVAIPGHGMNKINAAYAFGYHDGHQNKSTAARLAVETVQNLTGLAIDHFVQADLIGFYRISKVIGKVPVNLCAPAKEANSGIDLPKGVSQIDGKQALAFVRQRYGFANGLGDIDRIHRQQYFLSAVFRKISSARMLLNPFKLKNLLNAVSSSLTMDQTLDPLKLAEQMQNLNAGNLSFITIPWDGFATTSVGGVVVVHPAQVRARVKTLTGRSGATTTAAPASSITVAVRNAAGADRAETTNANTLRQLGFHVGTVDTSPTPLASTVVEYPAGMEVQAATVAAHVPGTTIQQADTVQQVTLLLGQDGRSVTAPTRNTRAPAGGSSSGVTNAQQATTGCIY